ncbi:MAG: histidine kinase, partial [Pelovirga sp.]
MAGIGNLKLSTKFNLILSSLLLGLFLVTAFLTFSEYQSMARSIALEQGRNVSKELITTFNHMSDIVRDEPETNYALVPQVVVTQIAQK